MQRTNSLLIAWMMTVFFAIGLSKDSATAQQIEVRFANPFQAEEQDERLQKFLRERYKFAWNAATTPVDIQKDLSTCVPFQVDYRALREIGISADAPVFSAYRGPENTLKPKAQSDSDPFASDFDPFASDVRTKPQQSDAITVVSKQQTKPWWTRSDDLTISRPSDSQPTVTNAAKLFCFLNASDLTVHNRAGQWLITTQEAADYSQSTRLYDVTKIASVKPIDKSISGSGYFDYGDGLWRDDSVVDVILRSIDPDTWESLGGPSVQQIFTVNDRHWLVITTCTTTHWKIQAFLNELTRN